MSSDRSTRSVLAAILLVAALFTAMNLVVSAAPALDFWLPLALLVAGAALVFAPNLDFRRSQPEEDELALSSSGGLQTFIVEQPALRPQTMTIRPDPESAEYATPVATVSEVLPFGEVVAVPVPQTPPEVTPASPETPAPAAEPEPAPEVTPPSPETPAPATEPAAEPTPMSPETPTPDAPETEVVEQGPSQKLPVDRTPDVSPPAPELKFSARNEYANPDESVSKDQPAPPPEADDSVTATERSEPEKQIVEEKTAAPQQPYEAERTGELTPEQADRIMDDSNGDNAHDNDVPTVNEAASARVTAQEVNGEGSVGSADDLTKIDGIGPKFAATLKAAGIDSFQKLANAPADQIRTIITDAGVRLIGEVESWAQQAGYAARGDWQGLETFNHARKSAD
jgi:predicted flap endonuclease-1-like 5' DNA nuclease